MPKKSNHEPVVRMSAPMPDGYVFVSKGNVYMTANCRKQTQAEGRIVYAVVDKNKRALGIRVPRPVRDTVWDSEAATRKDREAAVRKRDKALELKFRQTVKKLFPAAPDGEIPSIVARAMQKGSGRVGRTSKVDIERRATLAVTAAIRHRHTDYDKKLKDGMNRTKARTETFKQVGEILATWRGRASPAQKAQKAETDNADGNQTKPQAKLSLRAMKRMRRAEKATKPTLDLRSGSRSTSTQSNSRNPPSPKERRMSKLRTRQQRKTPALPVESPPSQGKIGQSLRDGGSEIEESDEYVGSSEDNCIWISSDEDD